ncbi:VOC family protein [Pseudalkalibacillus sp. SCS-8]|uniref:VOC family protein n=1 Tax=Pseudalkalibacillus nanhaiensis TaxID=3115291 RepID=UPI0032DA2D22
MVNKLQKISTNLWFDSQAKEAANFYTSVFENSEIGRITRYGKEGYEIHGKPEGTVMNVEFQLNGQPFVALNGGSQIKFNESISFIIHCETQEEIDYYWEKLSERGDEKAQQCGWLKDQFGISWQIVPAELPEMLNDPDPEKASRVRQALLQMKKIDIATLKRAYAGETE